MKYIFVCAVAAASFLAFAPAAFANEVEIVNAKATQSGDTWRFDVTLKHADEGWDHYANLWQVETEGGDVLGERVLAHPHVNEQPFTRSLGGVAIPTELSKVYIRARDSVHGWSPERFEIILR